MSPVRPRHQRDRSGPVWLKPSRPSLRTRLQRFLERHPRSFVTVITILLGYVSIGTVYRLAQARATVTSGWPEAVVIGVGVTVALLTLIVTGRRQRPYSRRQIWPLQGILCAFVLGFAGNQPLVFSGWARIPYRVTSAFQAGTLALLAPILLAITALLVYTTWAIFARRHRWTRRPEAPSQLAQPPGTAEG